MDAHGWNMDRSGRGFAVLAGLTFCGFHNSGFLDWTVLSQASCHATLGRQKTCARPHWWPALLRSVTFFMESGGVGHASASTAQGMGVTSAAAASRSAQAGPAAHRVDDPVEVVDLSAIPGTSSHEGAAPPSHTQVRMRFPAHAMQHGTVPRAPNLAFSLACWVAGSLSAPAHQLTRHQAAGRAFVLLCR